MLRRVVSCAVIAAAAGSAHAAFFSMASDVDHLSWTFAGGGDSVRDAQDPFDPQILLIDDDNGPASPLPFFSEFGADFTITHLASTPFVGGKFTHLYTISGSFSFVDVTTGFSLVCNIRDGLFSTVGNGGLSPTWGSTATIQASDDYGSVEYVWTGPDAPELGLFAGTSVGLDDAAFTLTVLNVDGKSGVALDAQTRLPVDRWFSEGSYSGSAVFVPAPGSLALIGLAGLAAARRRRA